MAAMLKPGKLYKCPEHYLFVYPTKEKAVRASGGTRKAATSLRLVASAAALLSQSLNYKVSFSEPNDIFMVIEKEDKFANVLFGDKQGWIKVDRRITIEKLKKII